MARLPQRLRSRLTSGLSDLVASLDARVAAINASVDAASSNSATERRSLGDRLERIEEEMAALRRLIVTHDEQAQRQLGAGLSSATSLLSVLPHLKIEGVLPPFTHQGFEVTGELAAFLYHLVRRHRPKIVFELGSGSSTILLAASVRANGVGRVISVEHDPRHCARTAQFLEQTQLSGWVDLIETPLVRQTFGAVGVHWYDLAPFLRGMSERIDLLFVDGPPGRIQALSRYPALPALAAHLAPRGLVLVDDAGRHDEMRMIELWRDLDVPFDTEPLDFLPRSPVLLTMAAHDQRVAELHRRKEEPPVATGDDEILPGLDRRTGAL